MAGRLKNHIDHQCGYRKPKLAYDNLLVALAACASTHRDNPDYRYTVYECGKCGYIHVGRIHPNDILYFEDMVIPYLDYDDAPVQKKTAIPKREKARIMARANVKWENLPHFAKYRYPRPDLQSKYRGYRPFENLRSELGLDESRTD